MSKDSSLELTILFKMFEKRAATRVCTRSLTFGSWLNGIRHQLEAALTGLYTDYILRALSAADSGVAV